MPTNDQPISRIVERLEKLCKHVFRMNTGYCGADFDRAEASRILHEWRERRVQELEELLAKHSLSPELSSTQLDTTKEKV